MAARAASDERNKASGGCGLNGFQYGGQLDAPPGRAQHRPASDAVDVDDSFDDGELGLKLIHPPDVGVMGEPMDLKRPGAGTGVLGGRGQAFTHDGPFSRSRQLLAGGKCGTHA